MGRSNLVFEELIGMSIETNCLSGLNPDDVLESTGQTLDQRLDELEARKAHIKELMQYSDMVFSTLEPNVASSFIDRAKLYGEAQALEWLQNLYSTNTL